MAQSEAQTPRSSGRATTRTGEANIGRILDAALALFARYGLRGTRIDEVAASAGMSKTNLLYYFRSKEALYTAVLQRTLNMWLDPLLALDPDEEPGDALARYIATKLEYSRTHPEASRLFAMEMLQGAPHLKAALATTLASIVADKKATIERWIEQGKLRAVAPHHLIFAMWATTQHYADFAAQIEAITGRNLGDEAFLQEAQTELAALILRGALPNR